MKNLMKVSMMLSLSLMSSIALANPLANTTWQTYEGTQPKAVIKFVTNANGSLDGTIVSTTRKEGQHLVGKKVVKNLANISGNKYGDGHITDPENGRTYNLTAVLNGQTLNLKGHYGPFSRSQTWKKK